MSVEQLERYLADMLEEQETIWGYKTHQVDANLRLKDLVKRAYGQTGTKVVVIIDEYDAPLLDVVHEKENLQPLRRIMQNYRTTYNLPSVVVIGCRLILLAIPSWSCLPGIICVTCINLIPC